MQLYAAKETNLKTRQSYRNSFFGCLHVEIIAMDRYPVKSGPADVAQLGER